MNDYGYVLRYNDRSKEKPVRYHRTNLELMTTFQLNEICHREKLVLSMLNHLDKEALIRLILRYRGADEYFLIRENNKNGWVALTEALAHVKLSEKQDIHITCSSKIIAYDNLAIGFYDNLALSYDAHFIGTNALVIAGDGKLCAVLNVEARGNDTNCLYLTKAAELPMEEAAVKNYSLYCMERQSSEILYRIYQGEETTSPGQLEAYRIPLLDFEVRKAVSLDIPLAMDFGTTNTTAGVYLDSQYFEQTGMSDWQCRGFQPEVQQGRQSGEVMGLRENDVNYVRFYDVANEWRETPLFPSVVCVLSVGEGKNKFLFGYEAQQLAASSYVDEGFCVFYDLKRWIADYEKVEEITDREGHRGFVKRKEILKAYFDYIIREAKNQYKCEIEAIHISCPVKQKVQFKRLFRDILPKYGTQVNEMIDEGVSVLYNTISGMIHSSKIRYGKEYKALIIDCGGGTTDLCSCTFRIQDKRIAYQIDIDTAYENGNTDFGGNNLTYRIMQILKLAIAARLGCQELLPVKDILAEMDTDIYRYVDGEGITGLYRKLEEEYVKAERFLPTRFKEYEQQSRADYYMVKNNFYFLFQLAETVKKEFYNKPGTLRIALASMPVEESAALWVPVDKWKMSVRKKGRLETVKDFPVVYFDFYEIELLLKGDIYDIIRQFMENMYEEGKVEEYSIIRLTGQSCKIDTFRDALKEFVPGKTIQFRHRSGDQSANNELKTTCVEGALRYLKDKKYGFADVTIKTQEPALPYRITAYTHSGMEIDLIHRLKRGRGSGMVSRNMENLTLELYLKDGEGRERYKYTCHSHMKDFKAVRYEDLERRYGEYIRQADTDDIVDREVKFFVWSKPADWSFVVVPICRKEESLHLGREEEFCFENDNWVRNFFDGMK